MIILFSTAVKRTGRPNETLLFFRVIEILVILAWMLSLWRFAWVVYSERQKSPPTLQFASQQCRKMLICV